MDSCGISIVLTCPGHDCFGKVLILEQGVFAPCCFFLKNLKLIKNIDRNFQKHHESVDIRVFPYKLQKTLSTYFLFENDIIETIHILRLDFLNSSHFMEFSQTSFDNIMVFLGVSPVLVSNPILLTFSTHLENPQYALPPNLFKP